MVYLGANHSFSARRVLFRGEISRKVGEEKLVVHRSCDFVFCGHSRRDSFNWTGEVENEERAF